MRTYNRSAIVRIAASTWAVFLCLAALFVLTACDRPGCDEKIRDRAAFERSILEDPTLRSLGPELVQRQMIFGECFYNNQVGVKITFQTPASYSQYQIAYYDDLYLAYTKEGKLISYGPSGQPAYTRDAIIAYLKQRIQKVESNPRVREVLSKTQPDPGNAVSLLQVTPRVFRLDNYIDYNDSQDLVTGYLLSNDFGWQEFPEIKLVHAVIEDRLLVGDLAACTINKGAQHSFTMAQLHNTPADPWSMRVAIQCGGMPKEAWILIDPDGSVRKLGID
jgi:hypothetical protein